MRSKLKEIKDTYVNKYVELDKKYNNTPTDEWAKRTEIFYHLIDLQNMIQDITRAEITLWAYNRENNINE